MDHLSGVLGTEEGLGAGLWTPLEMWTAVGCEEGSVEKVAKDSKCAPQDMAVRASGNMVEARTKDLWDNSK